MTVKNVHDMTDDEWTEYQGLASGDWLCDHDKKFTEDCEACDIEFAIPPASGSSACDHGVSLRADPKHGDCPQCDIECSNTPSMSASSIYRMVTKLKFRYSATEQKWQEVQYSQGGGWTAATPVKNYAKQCKHFMQEFMITDELAVYASADRDAPYHKSRKAEDYPDLGVYLYSGWVSGVFTSTPGLDVPWTHDKALWPMAWLDWPDYSVPGWDKVVAAIPWVMDYIKQGKRVETGCMGGHGRTGTMLALLMVHEGVKPGTAMKAVWDRYCVEAIESASQADLIVKYYEHLHGKGWKKSSAERNKVNACLNVFKPAKKEETKKDKKKGKKDKTTTTSGKHDKCIHFIDLDQPCVACEYQGWS